MTSVRWPLSVRTKYLLSDLGKLSDLGSDVSDVLGLSDVVAGFSACFTNSACCCVLSKIQHIASDVSDWMCEMSDLARSGVWDVRFRKNSKPEYSRDGILKRCQNRHPLHLHNPVICFFLSESLFIFVSGSFSELPKSACCSVLPKIQRVAENSVCCSVLHCSVLQRVVAKNAN